MVSPVESGPAEFWVNAGRSKFRHLISRKSELQDGDDCSENFGAEFLMEAGRLSACKIVKKGDAYGLLTETPYVFDTEVLFLVYDEFQVTITTSLAEKSALLEIIESFRLEQ